MDTLLWMLNLAWRLACFIAGWYAVKWVLHYRKSETFHEVGEVLRLWTKAKCITLKRRLVHNMAKDAVNEDPDAEIRVEATVK